MISSMDMEDKMINKRLTYLASPYTHPDPQIEEQRFKTVCVAAGILMNQGMFVFSPIAHCHSIANSVNLPKSYDYWKDYCELTLGQCNELIVLTIDGWEESKGIREEIKFAAKSGIPIKYAVYREDAKTVSIFNNP